MNILIINVARIGREAFFFVGRYHQFVSSSFGRISVAKVISAHGKRLRDDGVAFEELETELNGERGGEVAIENGSSKCV